MAFCAFTQSATAGLSICLEPAVGIGDPDAVVVVDRVDGTRRRVRDALGAWNATGRETERDGEEPRAGEGKAAWRHAK